MQSYHIKAHKLTEMSLNDNPNLWNQFNAGHYKAVLVLQDILVLNLCHFWLTTVRMPNDPNSPNLEEVGTINDVRTVWSS